MMLVKKIFVALVATLLAFGVLSPGVKAAEMTSANPGFFGQNHLYSVTFRGNGEAIVTLKVVFNNSSDNPLNKISLRVPRVNPVDLVVYQVIGEPKCGRYAPAESGVTYMPPRCLDWQKYQKAKVEYVGDTIDITLPNSVKTNGTGSYLLYFRAFGYAKKDLLGAFPYTFETLKMNDKVNSLQVGISTDSDLFLRGAKGTVEYRFEAPMAAMKAAGMEAVANPQMDNVYQQIGQGTIIKNASNLMPLESYKVSGSYADSTWKVYGQEIGIGALIVTVLVIFLVLGIKFLAKKMIINPTVKTAVPPAVIVLGTSFAASLLAVGWTVGIWVFINAMGTMSNLSGNLLILLAEAIFSVLVYGTLIILPAIVVGVKKGWTWGLATAGATIGWLALYLASFLLVTFLSSQRSYYPPPLYTQIKKAPIGPSETAPVN